MKQFNFGKGVLCYSKEQRFRLFFFFFVTHWTIISFSTLEHLSNILNTFGIKQMQTTERTRIKCANVLFKNDQRVDNTLQKTSRWTNAVKFSLCCMCRIRVCGLFSGFYSCVTVYNVGFRIYIKWEWNHYRMMLYYIIIIYNITIERFYQFENVHDIDVGKRASSYHVSLYAKCKMFMYPNIRVMRFSHNFMNNCE